MVLQETLASQALHFDQARRAQMENPFTTQNQVVELQKAAIVSQNKSQSVAETKNNPSLANTKEKQSKEELVTYGRDGMQKARNLTGTGSRFNSLA